MNLGEAVEVEGGVRDVGFLQQVGHLAHDGGLARAHGTREQQQWHPLRQPASRIS